MDQVRDSGRRRLIVVTAGVGVLAAGAATAVGATRPAPHHAPRPAAPTTQAPQDDPGTVGPGPVSGQAPTPTPEPPMASSNGS